MSANNKAMLAAGGILAVALTIGSQIDGTKTPVPEPVSVQIAKAERGAEIKALRTVNSEVFKADSVWVHPKGKDGKEVKADSFKVAAFTARVYARPKYFRDADGDTLRALDTTVREISALAKLNPLKTHDRYVDAGPYTAQWMADAPGDYRMNAGSGSVKYRALFNAAVKAEATETGMKETVTLADEKAPHTLRWTVETDGSLVANAQGGFDVRAKDGTVPMQIQRPIAWDADNKPVMASATVEGDTLTFRVTVLPGQKYPVTVDPTTSVKTVLDAYLTSADATYITARDRTEYQYATVGGYLFVGQTDDPIHTVYRTFLRFPLLANLNLQSVDACSLFVFVLLNNDPDSFDISAVYSPHKGAPKIQWANDFNGWDSTGSYQPGIETWIMAEKNTSTITSGEWNGLAFTGDQWNALFMNVHASSDTFGVALLSSDDIINTAPTDSAYIVLRSSIYGGGSTYAPYLSFSMTLKTPGPLVVHAASTTSVKLSWTDNIAGETGFRIYDLDAAAYVDSTAADDSTKTITGLTANTKYRYKVEVKGGTADGQQSAADSTYTRAVAPMVAPSITFVADSLLKVVTDTTGTGNPSYTEYAIQDSVTGKYFDGRFNRFFSTTAAESILWRTYAAWGGTAGDTVAVGVGKKYVIRAKARSGE